MQANHPFARRSLNPLDENGQPGCAVCGRPPSAHNDNPDDCDICMGRGFDYIGRPCRIHGRN